MPNVRTSAARPTIRRISSLSSLPCLIAGVGTMLYVAIPAHAVVGEAATAGGSSGSSGSTAPSGQPGSSSASSLATATLEQCIVAVDPATRSATFNGQMSTVPGARRMAMQIAVQEEAPGDAAFHTLAAAGPSGWRRSEAGVKIYKYVRQVTDLPAPGAFRAIVQFRWFGEKGRVIRRAVRRTPVCAQPDERPKLVVDRVVATAVTGSPGLAAYRMVVRNEGRGSAGPFGVVLSVGGIAQPPLSVASLDPGTHAVLEEQGPTCSAGSQVEVTLDPAHQVSEAAGGGQSDTLSCPLPVGS